ncbi:MAG TPA: cytochrome c maturation protein CcmE [bacterium]|nr:cytochrome c maturation protein CcmE [bacterium]
MKPKIVAGVVVIIAALAYLFVGSLKNSALYYLTVSELFAQSEFPVNEGLRVNGYVAPASIRWDANKGETRFLLFEGKDSLRVCYKGVAPDQLAEAQQVVVEGKMAANGELAATKILLKCPSKYEVKKQ